MTEKNINSKESLSELSNRVKEALSQFEEVRGFL
jgi:hypothetical protein